MNCAKAVAEAPLTNPTRVHAPTDIGLCSLKTRSIFKKRYGRSRSAISSACEITAPAAAIQRASRTERVATAQSSAVPPVLKQKCQQASSQKQPGANCRRGPAFLQINRRHFWFGRQIVAARISAHDEHGMGAANTGVRCIIERRVFHPASVQLRNALARFIAETFDLPDFIDPV